MDFGCKFGYFVVVLVEFVMFVGYGVVYVVFDELVAVCVISVLLGLIGLLCVLLVISTNCGCFDCYGVGIMPKMGFWLLCCFSFPI